MDNATRRQLLNRHRASGFPGSILDVYNAYSQGVDLIGQFEQQNNIEVARTPEQQQQGLRPAHQAGDINKSMIFPNVPPNTPFTTEGMKAPINIEKYDEQGHLVKSYENVPPGVRNLPTGPQRGTVIETPANMQGGGVRKYQNAGVTISPEEYEAKLDAAINKYGDVGLSFDPVSQEFAPGVQMLDPAEVAADFDLDNASMQARNNYFAYKNLGQQGLQDSMGMFNSINNARNQFAEDYLAPALDAGLFLGTAGASSGASALARGFGTATRVAPKAVGSAIRGINTGKSMLSNTVGNLTTRALNPVASTRFGQAVGQGVDYANKGAKYLMKPGQSVMNWAGNTRVGSAIGNFVNAPQTLLGGQTLGQASSAYTTAAGAYNAPKSFAKLTEGDIGGAASGISKLPVGNQIASALKAPKTLYNMYSGAKGLGEIAQGDILQGTSDFSKVLPGTGLYRNTVTAGNLIGSNSTPTRRTAYMSPKEMQSGSWRDSFVAESTAQPNYAEQAFINEQNPRAGIDQKIINELEYGIPTWSPYYYDPPGLTPVYPIFNALTLLNPGRFIKPAASKAINLSKSAMPESMQILKLQNQAARMPKSMRQAELDIIDDAKNIFNTARREEMGAISKLKNQADDVIRQADDLYNPKIIDETTSTLDNDAISVTNLLAKQAQNPLYRNKYGGARIRKYQGAGPKKVFTMGMKDKYDIIPSNPISSLADNDPAKFVDTAGADFNLQWNNSPMAKKMLTDSYLKSSGNTSFLSHLPYVGSYFFSEPSDRADEMTNKRNQSILNTQFRATPTEEDFKDLYSGDYRSGIRAFASMNQLMPSASYTAYNPTWSKNTTPNLLGVGVHERSHASDNAGSFIPPADIKMMYDASSSEKGSRELFPTSDAYKKYVADPTETRARIMQMRRGLSALGVDIFNSPVSEEDFENYLKSVFMGFPVEYEELRSIYTKEDIFKMLNAIAYEGDDKQPENVAKRGGIRIKERNRGKFTAFAKSKGMSVQEAARHVLANKDRYSTALIRRANFARNAARWNR
jgi:uncharacterized membrane protein (UPF0127 family)